jgi:type IV pilus assembly protein PilC
MFGVLGGGGYFFIQTWKRSEKMQIAMDRLLLKDPGVRRPDPQGGSRPLDAHLSTMFAAGVPLVEALDSVGGAAGNAVYSIATEQIQRRSPPARRSPRRCRTPACSRPWCCR